jgi:hypothetical protein
VKRQRTRNVPNDQDEASPSASASGTATLYVRLLEEFLLAQPLELRSRTFVPGLCRDYRADVLTITSMAEQFSSASALVCNGAPCADSARTARAESMQNRFAALLQKLLEHTKKLFLMPPHAVAAHVPWSVLSSADAPRPHKGKSNPVEEVCKAPDVWSEFPVRAPEPVRECSSSSDACGTNLVDSSFWQPLEDAEGLIDFTFDCEPDTFSFVDEWWKSDPLLL